MSDLRDKLKRQIEIVGLILQRPRFYFVEDLELLYGCTSVTIKRDLLEIREMGIDIHSIPKKGIAITGGIGVDMLKKLASDYLFLTQVDGSWKKSVHLLIDLKKEQSIIFLTRLQFAIDHSREILLSYKKHPKAQAKQRLLKPLVLFENQNEWRLLAYEGESRKQFLLQKVEEVAILETTFTPPDYAEAETAALNGFGAWLSNVRIPVTLLFKKDWLASGKTPLLAPDQVLTTNPDGTVILTCTVHSVEDVARWVVGRGGEVIPQAPPELHTICLQLANDVLNSLERAQTK